MSQDIYFLVFWEISLTGGNVLLVNMFRWGNICLGNVLPWKIFGCSLETFTLQCISLEKAFAGECSCWEIFSLEYNIFVVPGERSFSRKFAPGGFLMPGEYLSRKRCSPQGNIFRRTVAVVVVVVGVSDSQCSLAERESMTFGLR